MGKYRIIVRKPVSKNLDGIPKKDAGRIVKAIQALAEDPRPPESKKISGEEKYRQRRGVYGIIYKVQDERRAICIVRVRHGRDAYR